MRSLDEGEHHARKAGRLEDKRFNSRVPARTCIEFAKSTVQHLSAEQE